MSLDPAAVRALVRAYGRLPPVHEAPESEPEPVDAVAQDPVPVVAWKPGWRDEWLVGNIMHMYEHGMVRQACVAQRPGEPVEVWWRV